MLRAIQDSSSSAAHHASFLLAAAADGDGGDGGADGLDGDEDEVAAVLPVALQYEYGSVLSLSLGH